MITLTSKYDCCGCTACTSAWNRGAIIMQEDEQGFLYPHINTTQCIDCGLCNKVCPVFRYDVISNKKNVNPHILALHHHNEKTWISSSSGGVFASLTDYALRQAGVIFGAIYDDNFVVVHRRAETQEDTLKFRGSKYVQSNLTGIYQQVKFYLQEQRFVLFSGTPCQVEGLKGYLQRSYDNLLTVDILCHGVPSPRVFHDYLNFIRQNSDFHFTGIFMKDKTFGWGYQNSRLFFGKNASQFNTVLSRLWNDIFYSHLTTRPSCHACRFTNYLRPGDITIGDFWGIEKHHPQFTDSRGISLIMLNNTKAEIVWNHIKDDFNYLESNIKECIQPNLKYPVPEPVNKATFWQDYASMPFFQIMNKYYRITHQDLLKNRFYMILLTLKKRFT